MRIAFDLDGVICQLRGPNETYSALNPVPGAIDGIRKLRSAGHYIILSTARHMKTCDGNSGKVVARQGKTTLDWLAKHGIEVDEIYFGKPWADLYVDDLAVNFTSWDSLTAILPDLKKASPLAKPVEITLVIPLAGKGSRFAGSRFVRGARTPKFLLDVAGWPMLIWAIRSFSDLPIKKIIFVVLETDAEEFCLLTELKAILSDDMLGRVASVDLEIVIQKESLPGQLLSVLEARPLLKHSGAIVIAAGDTFIKRPFGENGLSFEDGIRGLISVTRAPGENWSFVQADQNKNVIGVSEKKRLNPSDFVSTGVYAFRDADEFLSAAENTIKCGPRWGSEHYVIPVYQEMIKSGAAIQAVEAECMCDMGTPQSLDTFLGSIRRMFLLNQ